MKGQQTFSLLAAERRLISHGPEVMTSVTWSAGELGMFEGLTAAVPSNILNSHPVY